MFVLLESAVLWEGWVERRPFVGGEGLGGGWVCFAKGCGVGAFGVGAWCCLWGWGFGRLLGGGLLGLRVCGDWRFGR